MNDLSVKKINKLIDEFIQSGKIPSCLIFGYKTYAMLMQDDKFADQIIKGKDEPLSRYYKKLKITLVTDKHYFQVG
ncbi:hypothetical protein [Acinetobacter sp.]|uniref:hypothetical protein n=1 Tax=Acinetobacter sp. TaxID=472 RepID=UPI00115AB87E|nr:hypothetical protein FM020_07890 [Acinetobacter tandoii]